MNAQLESIFEMPSVFLEQYLPPAAVQRLKDEAETAGKKDPEESKHAWGRANSSPASSSSNSTQPQEKGSGKGPKTGQFRIRVHPLESDVAGGGTEGSRGPADLPPLADDK